MHKKWCASYCYYCTAYVILFTKQQCTVFENNKVPKTEHDIRRSPPKIKSLSVTFTRIQTTVSSLNYSACTPYSVLQLLAPRCCCSAKNGGKRLFESGYSTSLFRLHHPLLIPEHLTQCEPTDFPNVKEEI